MSRDDFLFDAPYWQNLAAQRDLSGHSDIATYWPAGKQRGQRYDYRHAC